MPKITLDWNTLYNFVTDAFVAVGVPRNDAVICTDVLLESDKRGIESHGVNRFKPIYIDRILDKIQKPVTEFEILRETPTTAVVDGHDGMGQVVGYKAMSMAIEKAKKYGMGMVAARNSCHYGIAGYYATMATKANMIGITGTNARPSIAPTFGVENMLGTNPLTIGLPTDEAFPFVIDCATSITQRGKLEYYARIGKSTPEGMVIGRDGRALTNTDEILVQLNTGEAALAPLGGIGEEPGRLQGLRLRDGGGNPLGGAAAGQLFADAHRPAGRQEGALSPRPLLHRHRHRGVYGRRRVQEDGGRHPARAARSQKAPGEERIYTAGEKEWDVWAVPQGQRRADQRGRAEGILGRARQIPALVHLPVGLRPLHAA